MPIKPGAGCPSAADPYHRDVLATMGWPESPPPLGKPASDVDHVFRGCLLVAAIYSRFYRGANRLQSPMSGILAKFTGHRLPEPRHAFRASWLAFGGLRRAGAAVGPSRAPRPSAAFLGAVAASHIVGQEATVDQVGEFRLVPALARFDTGQPVRVVYRLYRFSIPCTAISREKRDRVRPLAKALRAV